LVAFNIWAQRIVARQERAAKIDFAALAKATQAPANGTVNYRRLQEPKSEVHFVTKLLTDELAVRAPSPDAIIIVGPKVSLEQKVPLDLLKESGAASRPIFYLNYNPDPVDESGPDSIGSALKASTGALTYDIVFPRDLGVAMRLRKQHCRTMSLRPEDNGLPALDANLPRARRFSKLAYLPDLSASAVQIRR
jgi:hypothetical protein